MDEKWPYFRNSDGGVFGLCYANWIAKDCIIFVFPTGEDEWTYQVDFLGNEDYPSDTYYSLDSEDWKRARFTSFDKAAESALNHYWELPIFTDGDPNE